MKRHLRAATVGAVFAAIGPFASIAGAPAVTPGFAGWYFGGHGAYEFGDSDFTTTPVSEVKGFNAIALGGGEGSSFGGDVDGWGAGLQAGYNHVSGRWLLGAEVSATGLQVEGTAVKTEGREKVYETEYNWRADITARLGYLVTDDTLLYVEGGWSFAEIDVREVPEDRRRRRGTPAADEAVIDGWTANLGIEHKLDDGVSAFVEYSYTDYGSESFTHESRRRDLVIEHDQELQAIKIGVNFKLN